MNGARSGASTSVTSSARPWRFERAPVGAALDRVRRRQHADPAVVGDRRGDLGLGLDHRHHLHPVLGGDLAGHVRADRGRRVAGDHQQLGAAVEQQLGDRARSARAARSGSLGPVGEPAPCRRGRRSPPRGSETRHSCRTVRPPTPESNIATGSEAVGSQERLVRHEEDRHDDDQPGERRRLCRSARRALRTRG